MSTQITIQGTINPDGTLLLDERVAMPAGRVRVTVQQVVPPSNDPLWQTMERIWTEQKTRGHVARSKEQIDAELRAMREEAEQEMQAAEKLHEECHKGPSTSGGPKQLMVFLDANSVIYFVERPPGWGAKAAAALSAFSAAGETFAVSDLVRMECLIGPLKSGDVAVLADFVAFFATPTIRVLAVSSAVCDRAALVRAQFGFKPLDSLHLAAAVENGCTVFLTNDVGLKLFPDISVQVLS